jgi:hypothetical protein
VRAYAAWRPEYRGYDLTLTEWRPDGRTAIVLPADLTVKTLAPNELHTDGPTFRMDNETAQAVLQALWDTGLRPNDGSGGKAEVDAMKKHIDFAEYVARVSLARVTAP